MFLTSTPALGLTIDFEEFAHGEVVSSAAGWTVEADNPARPFDLAVAFDTGQTGTQDFDLEFGSGWAGGNIENQPLGNILILQEDDACPGGICTNPDDEVRGGSLLFLFEETFRTARFDLIDIDPEEVAGGSVTFLSGGALGSEVAQFDFADLPGLDPSVEFGNRTANRIDLGEIGAFDALRVELESSGGVDNLVLVAEPATAAMLLLGLGGLAWVGRSSRHPQV